MNPPRFSLRWTDVANANRVRARSKASNFPQNSQSRPIFEDAGHAMSYQDVVAKLNELAELAGSQIPRGSDGVAEPE